MTRNQSTDQRDLELFYRDHMNALDEAAAAFNLPRDTARDLAHQVILAGIRRMDTIADPRAWLLGAFTAAAQAAVKDAK